MTEREICQSVPLVRYFRNPIGRFNLTSAIMFSESGCPCGRDFEPIESPDLIPFFQDHNRLISRSTGDNIEPVEAAIKMIFFSGCTNTCQSENWAHDEENRLYHRRTSRSLNSKTCDCRRRDLRSFQPHIRWCCRSLFFGAKHARRCQLCINYSIARF